MNKLKTLGNKKRTYAGSGVDYTQIDPVKLFGQKFGHQTYLEYMRRFKQKPLATPLEHMRGESAYVFRLPIVRFDGYVGHIEEGLGTLIHLADLYYRATGNTYGYYCAGVSGVAMATNDLATLGMPSDSVQMHLAVGDGKYLTDKKRVRSLFEGWRDGTISSGAVWTGGETPILRKIALLTPRWSLDRAWV